MHVDEYMGYYILSYFDKNKAVNASQIFHVLQGKRTPSMFYLAEKNRWHHGFGKFTRFSRQRLELFLKRFNQLKWIEVRGKGYVLTELGSQVKNEYFSTHYFPSHIHTFSNVNLRRPFWERYQLLTQVFSERSFFNNKYTPIIKDPLHQEQVRFLFHYFKNESDNINQKWIDEQYSVFNHLKDSRVNHLFKHLSGHDKIGETTSQVREKLNMNELEYEYYHFDTIELIIQRIKENPQHLPLMQAIIQSLQSETNFGLSSSTYQTYLYIEDGLSIQEISKERSLKENTIREHILEMAFVLDNFPFDKFVSESLAKELNAKFIRDEDYSFKKAVSDFDSIHFMDYRLIELERMRR